VTNDDLAVTLSILRIVRRWSQSELAEAAGVTTARSPTTSGARSIRRPKPCKSSSALWGCLCRPSTRRRLLSR
jgi:transcriptional regulator with XRE-family HTH domain